MPVGLLVELWAMMFVHVQGPGRGERALLGDHAGAEACLLFGFVRRVLPGVVRGGRVRIHEGWVVCPLTSSAPSGSVLQVYMTYSHSYG